MDTNSPTHIWVHSDLQLSEPAQARETLSVAVDDLLSLDVKLDAIWCLGDAHCGIDEPALREVAEINVAQLHRLEVPVYYVMGNHEMDLTASGVRHFPLYELASNNSNWRTAALDAFYFCLEFGGYLVVFMGDHAALKGDWWTSHGRAKSESYPYSSEDYMALRRQISDYNGSVIIASHYAFPGGQRPGPLMEQLFPLPENVCLHLHGHAHIGDLVWNKDNPWQRKNPIIGHAIHQFNISALESLRSPGSHSALLEICPDGIKLRIRCHREKRWTEEFYVNSTAARKPNS